MRRINNNSDDLRRFLMSFPPFHASQMTIKVYEIYLERAIQLDDMKMTILSSSLYTF